MANITTFNLLWTNFGILTCWQQQQQKSALGWIVAAIPWHTGLASRAFPWEKHRCLGCVPTPMFPSHLQLFKMFLIPQICISLMIVNTSKEKLKFLWEIKSEKMWFKCVGKCTTKSGHSEQGRLTHPVTQHWFWLDLFSDLWSHHRMYIQPGWGKENAWSLHVAHVLRRRNGEISAYNYGSPNTPIKLSH